MFVFYSPKTRVSEIVTLSEEKIQEIKQAANIVDVIGQHVPLKKNGKDYFGLCPFHPEKTASFSVVTEKQMFFCFGCSESGDVFEYIMKIKGIPFFEAAKQLAMQYGISLPDADNTVTYKPYPAKPVHTKKPEFTPEKAVQPKQLWQDKAEKLVTWAHEQLLNNKERLAWLKKRGIELDTVKEFMLGFNPGKKGNDLYRPRESWGLETILKDDGKTRKKLWIPIGIVIPYIINDEIIRIRIRTDRDQLRYYVMPGSGMRCMLFGESKYRAYIVVESELDGYLIYQETRQNGIGVLSMGSSSRKPDIDTYESIKNTPVILNALDADRAGAEANLWWEKTLSQNVRWPVPFGKDPGDAFEKGLNIGAWVKSGLPSAWSWKTKVDAVRTAGRFSSCLDNKGPAPENHSYENGDIGEFVSLVKNSPVVIHIRSDSIKVDCPDSWSSKNWDTLKRISKLVYFKKEISGLFWGIDVADVDRHNVEKIFETRAMVEK